MQIVDPKTRARASPRRSGWYVAWRPLETGAIGRGVYRCVGRKERFTCAPPGEPTFLPTTHDFFADALWRGPFPTERAALVVDGFHRV